MIAPHIAAWALNKRKSNTDVAAVVATHVSNINDKPKKRKLIDDEHVLETKGGGGYQPPPQPTPQEQAAARDWEAQQDFDREQRRQEQIDKAAADKKVIDDAAWKSGKDSAYTGAKSGAASRLNSLGIQSGDPYGVWEQVNNRYDTANNALTTGADYSTAFNSGIVDEILGTARTGQRNKYNQAFNSQISPYYAEDEFSSTSDDAILQSILDQQYNDALTDLTQSRDRGITNSNVYERAVRDLGTAKATANTDLQGIGGNILKDITGDINTRRQGSLDSAANWDFGTVYDPSQEANRIRSYADERRGGLEGEIRGAVGGREFFDVNSLLGKANAKTGSAPAPTSAGGSALYDTFENEATRNAQNTRQNEGTF